MVSSAVIMSKRLLRPIGGKVGRITKDGEVFFVGMIVNVVCIWSWWLSD